MIGINKNHPEYTLNEIAGIIGGNVLGDGEIKIKEVAGLKEAGPGSITFLANPKYISYLPTTKASALIANKEEPLFKGSILVVEDPYLAFAMVLEIFNPPRMPEPGIHSDAVLESDVRIGEEVSIQAFAYISRKTDIGRGVRIMAGAFIGEDCQIGDYSTIYPNVTLYSRTIIGKEVIIHAGSVIGSDGFGYAKKEGIPYKIPQTGRVVIEDSCEIGANVTIDRGTIGDTRIGRGTKIDNLVQIGHNVVIGPYSIIVSQVGISGSTQIGKGVVLAGQVGVTGHITIGDRVIVAAKAGVTKDIGQDQTIGGFMGMPIGKWRRAEAVYRNLPELQKSYREILRRIELLEDMLKSHH